MLGYVSEISWLRSLLITGVCSRVFLNGVRQRFNSPGLRLAAPRLLGDPRLKVSSRFLDTCIRFLLGDSSCFCSRISTSFSGDLLSASLDSGVGYKLNFFPAPTLGTSTFSFPLFCWFKPLRTLKLDGFKPSAVALTWSPTSSFSCMYVMKS